MFLCCYYPPLFHRRCSAVWSNVKRSAVTFGSPAIGPPMCERSPSTRFPTFRESCGISVPVAPSKGRSGPRACAYLVVHPVRLDSFTQPDFRPQRPLSRSSTIAGWRIWLGLRSCQTGHCRKPVQGRSLIPRQENDDSAANRNLPPELATP